ncbi:PP-loop family-domain-containing protein [Scleroderma yunnanense]
MLKWMFMGPITLTEFFIAFSKCIPPSGWSKLAVANSAGPDSTCLLFLLAQLIADKNRPSLPCSLVSLHVDHSLQAASSHMALQAAANAISLGIQHHTLRIPWGKAPFPPRPLPGTALENHAREARYHIIFNGMSQAGVPVVAFGHHADDQVETALMRLAKGSTEIGAAGMRRCRRWGMGSGNSEHALGWVGHRGMDRFIVRPLLDFPKDRILATCDAHALNYVDDPTNFQPEVTLRNAVRHMLNAESSASVPQDILASLEQVRNVSSSLQSLATDLNGTRERLRHATAFLAARASQVDSQVTEHLQECTLPSPPATLLLSFSHLLAIQDPVVRFAMVLRIMRYISFHPWGSIRADGDRRRAGINRIARRLWSSVPEPALLKKFTAGGGVLWSPVLYHPEKQLKPVIGPLRHSQRPEPAQFAWLASRIPPFFKNPQEGAGSASRLIIDVTKQFHLVDTKSENNTPEPVILEFLYDCRFLIRFNLSRMPKHVQAALHSEHHKPISIKIMPHTQYFWPKVVLQQGMGPDMVLAVLGDKGEVDMTNSPPWISMEWVRLLDAT